MLHFPFLSSIPWDSFPLPRASCSMSDIYLLVCHMDISENTHSAFPPTQYHFEIDACYSLQALVSDCCLVFFQKDIPYFNYQFPSRQISQLFPTTAINNAVKSNHLNWLCGNLCVTYPKVAFFKCSAWINWKCKFLDSTQTY